ncbi:MAG: hypothetical protein GY816_19485 [Cytophagales bacterium]|nr:hypothetical protein [Cytophagales bacterium]
MKPQKAFLGYQTIAYLGFLVSKGGISINPDKISAINSMPLPSNISELRQQLGMFNFYRKFIKNFSQICHPLFQLLKSEANFKWNSQCTRAIHQLRKLLTSAPLLQYPNLGADFIITSDASLLGIGGQLSQIANKDGMEHPIAFVSRALKKYEKNYSINELEALAVVYCFEVFRPYVLLRHTTIYTDNIAIKWVFSNPNNKGRLSKWALQLSEFRYTIEHKKGKQNTVSDALSRQPVDIQNLQQLQVSAVTRNQNPSHQKAVQFLPLAEVAPSQPLIRSVAQQMENIPSTSTQLYLHQCHIHVP